MDICISPLAYRTDRNDPAAVSDLVTWFAGIRRFDECAYLQGFVDVIRDPNTCHHCSGGDARFCAFCKGDRATSHLEVTEEGRQFGLRLRKHDEFNPFGTRVVYPDGKWPIEPLHNPVVGLRRWTVNQVNEILNAKRQETMPGDQPHTVRTIKVDEYPELVIRRMRNLYRLVRDPEQHGMSAGNRREELRFMEEQVHFYKTMRPYVMCSADKHMLEPGEKGACTYCESEKPQRAFYCEHCGADLVGDDDSQCAVCMPPAKRK